MNKTKIEWCDYTWNPIVGCKTGCYYCYAERMNKRFNWIKDWKEPEFLPKRLYDPFGKKAGKVFVGSMCDLFGGWIPSNWIQQILDICYLASQHEFMFLTKYPARYFEFHFPDNCWLGATVEKEDLTGGVKLHALRTLNPTDAKKFISIEPLLGYFGIIDLSFLDLVIVGAMTGVGAIKPDREWIESIKHSNIFYKENIKQYL